MRKNHSCISILLPLLLPVLIVLILSMTQAATSQLTPNKNFVKAVDVATSIYTKSVEWRKTLENAKMMFQGQDCSLTSKDFPSTFNFTRDVLKVCGNSEAMYPWIDVHHNAGTLLAKTIREHYKLSKLDAQFIPVNTSIDGYFNAMKRAVDSGECDVAVSSTNWSSERMKAVHFQCAYASTHFGYLRSELDPQIHVHNETELNLDGIKVAVSIGTITDTWATNNLKKATIIRVSSYSDAFSMVVQKQIHAIVSDSMDLFIWMSQHKNNCSTCQVKAFGEAFPMGTFISSSLVDTSSAATLTFTSLFVLLVIIQFF